MFIIFQKYVLSLFNAYLLDDSEFLALHSSKNPGLYLVFKDNCHEAFNSMVKCSNTVYDEVPCLTESHKVVWLWAFFITKKTGPPVDYVITQYSLVFLYYLSQSELIPNISKEPNWYKHQYDRFIILFSSSVGMEKAVLILG